LPAITYLPILAEYFGVTTDNLLGINKQDAASRLRQRMQKLPKSSQAVVESLIEEMLKKQ
jgi:hypothetical protein